MFHVDVKLGFAVTWWSFDEEVYWNTSAPALETNNLIKKNHNWMLKLEEFIT